MYLKNVKICTLSYEWVKVETSNQELQTVISNLPEFITDIKELLQYLTDNNLKEIYANIFIVIRILRRIPASTASTERSFRN